MTSAAVKDTAESVRSWSHAQAGEDSNRSAPSCPSELVRELERRAAAAPPVTSLPPAPSTADVVTHAIRRSVATHIDNAPGVVLGDDPEHLHRARVAIRRLRSDLRTFEPLLDSSWSRCLRSDLRRLARVMGEVRDADVLIVRFDDCASELPSRAEVDTLIANLVAFRTVRQRELTAYMESNGYATLLDRLFEAARDPALDPEGPTSADTLSRLVRRPWRRLTKTVKRLPDDPPDEMLHAVRIRTKRARYAAEAVAPALGKPARRFAKRAMRLQQVLGALHDEAVAHEWLTNWSSGHHAPQAVFAAGQLDGLEIARRSAARAAWRDAWRDLDRSKNTSWIT